MKKPVYLDNHATTQMDPRVLETMLPYFTEVYGNAASKNHAYGRDASRAVEESRAVIAKSIGAKNQEIVFTSGATEAINLAIKGIAQASPENRKHFITVKTEHKAVLDCFQWLEENGYETTLLSVDKGGLIDLKELKSAIRKDTALISIMAANNEIGVIQPLEEIGSLCHEAGCYFMTDATQAFGKLPLNVEKMNIDLLTCSGHKIYGPKGVGALYVRRSNPHVKAACQINGGGHERGFRSGTLNVPGIVGFATAYKIAHSDMKKENARIGKMRDTLQSALLEAIPNAKVNGHMEQRVTGNLNVCFPGVESEALIIRLKDEVAFSSGSACTTAAIQPSHVLKELGMSEDDIYSSVRFGLGRFNTQVEMNRLIPEIIDAVTELQSFAF